MLKIVAEDVPDGQLELFRPVQKLFKSVKFLEVKCPGMIGT